MLTYQDGDSANCGWVMIEVLIILYRFDEGSVFKNTILSGVFGVTGL